MIELIKHFVRSQALWAGSPSLDLGHRLSSPDEAAQGAILILGAKQGFWFTLTSRTSSQPAPCRTVWGPCCTVWGSCYRTKCLELGSITLLLYHSDILLDKSVC